MKWLQILLKKGLKKASYLYLIIKLIVMETVEVKKSDLSKILNTAEILVDEVEQALSQDEIANKRIKDIMTGKISGRTEKELDKYLKKRGVKIE